MKLTHKKAGVLKISLIAFTASLALGAGFAKAADYPDKTVSWVVPYPPGGPTDLVGRLLADAFSKELNGTFVVENKPGASGAIGINHTIRSKPDGHTISMLAAPGLTAPFMQEKSPYNLETDIEPIGIAYTTPPILVVNVDVFPDVTDIKSLAEAVKGKSLSYTSSGIGSTGHLTMELIRDELDIDGVHIPFHGGNPAVTALLSGEVGVMLSDSVAVLPHIRSGKLRPIAVNSTERLDVVPDVPTIKEQGIQSVEAQSWSSIFTTKGTPPEVIAKLNAALKKALEDPANITRMKAAGAYPMYSTPEQMQDFIRNDSALWKKVIEENDLKPK